jgi:hypothetical protein
MIPIVAQPSSLRSGNLDRCNGWTSSLSLDPRVAAQRS